MFFDLNEILGTYLMPILLALAFLVLMCVIFLRRHGDELPHRAPPTQGHPPEHPIERKTVRLADIPDEPAPVAAPPAVAAPEPVAAEPASLLLVDDSAVARAKLGKLFGGAGYRVTLAKDGVEALERLAEQRFQLMITDLEMPNKDGFELIAAVQGSLETEDMPVIAITGHDDMQARVHQVQGLFGIYKKPWNDRELLKRVEVLVAMRKG
jgi:CheY-like chemotaxis protein